MAVEEVGRTVGEGEVSSVEIGYSGNDPSDFQYPGQVDKVWGRGLSS